MTPTPRAPRTSAPIADGAAAGSTAPSDATAPSNATAELRAREAELAIVHEIGTALARQLEFEAITELVGERVRSIFDAPTMFIAVYDASSGRISFPYSVDEGQRFDRTDVQIGPGLTSMIINTGRPVRIGSDEEATRQGAIQIGGSETQSFLGVPIVAGDRVIGVVGMERVEFDAFSEADERLLSTLASSMGVALENTRLFDETKRLLAESDERAAELAVVTARSLPGGSVHMTLDRGGHGPTARDHRRRPGLRG